MSVGNFILISDLETLVKADKSKSSARNYLSMLNSLRIFLGGDNSLPINNITPAFVQSFGDSMLQRDIAPSTARLYKQMLRAMLNKQLGKSYRELIKTAFKDTGSVNEPTTHILQPADVATIASSPLDNSSLLQKARDVFMLSFYGGGLSLDALKDIARSDTGHSAILIPHQKDLIERFESQHGTPFCDYIQSLSDEAYSQRLYAIGRMLNLKAGLTPLSSADAWVKAALRCGLGPEVISACLKTPTTYINVDVDASVTNTNAAANRQYYQNVADSIHNSTLHWYVMRCHDISPAEAAKLLDTPSAQTYIERAETFMPVIPSERHDKSLRILGDMLFFRSRADTASRVKKAMWPKAYVYANRSTGRPSFIPDEEMRMFMLLSNIASDTIEYFFPDVNTPEFNTDDRVTVIDGNFCGQVGVVRKLSDDKLKVFIKIEAFNGAIITAEIHKSFLKPC